MNHSDMVAKLAKPGEEIIETLSPNSMHNLHMAIGISGEVGEFAEAALDKMQMEPIREEVGDMLFYIEGLCQGLEFELPPIIDLVPVTKSDMYRLIARCSVHAGNILDITKKVAIYNKPIEIAMVDAIRTDLIQLRLLVLSISKLFGVYQEDALIANIEKLGERYEGHNYSDAAAQTRADKEDEELEPALVEETEQEKADADQELLNDSVEGADESEALSAEDDGFGENLDSEDSI